MELKNKRVVVTGGSGFLGTYVVNQLRSRGCHDVFVPRSREFDLRREQHIQAMLMSFRPEVVIHLAATVGGIGANQKNPGKFFYDNLIMGVQLMEQSRLFQIEKFVAIGTVCSYPKFTQVPFSEDDLWNGYPEETNAPYGLAKKMMLVQSQTYREQYGFNSIFLLPVNLYGPGDNFDLETSHVIPAIVRKCLEAVQRGDSSITLWGTGKASREFLYVEDAAEAIIKATERYNFSKPVNIGSGREVSIQELVEPIKRMTGFRGEIIWDQSKPDGQPRRALNTSRAKEYFGFQAKMELTEGLKRTVEWYLEQKKAD